MSTIRAPAARLQELDAARDWLRDRLSLVRHPVRVPHLARLTDRVLVAICVATLPLVLFGVAVWAVNQERARTNALEGISYTAELARANIDSQLTSTVALLDLLSQTRAVVDGDWAESTRLFRTVVVRDGLVQNIFATGADGEVHATTALFAFDQRNALHDRGFADALEGRPAFVTRLLSHATHDPAVTIMLPIRGAHRDSWVGALGAEIKLASLQKRVAGTDVSKLLGLSLVDYTGTYLVHRDWERVQRGDSIGVPAIGESLARAARGSLVYQNAEGDQYLAAFTKLDTTDWTVVVEYPANMITPELGGLLVNSLAVLVLVLAMSFGIAIVVARSVTHPLNLVSDRARQIAIGKFRERLELGSLRELADLGHAFNSMADSLAARLAELGQVGAERREYAHRLRELLARTVTTQEEERRRIALDVHDGTAQIVAGALYHLLAIDDAKVDGQTRHSIATARTLIERGLRELRVLLFALHPTLLEELGLEQALRAHVAAQATEHGYPIRYRCFGMPYHLGPKAQLAVFRICQEALHNAIRHAQTNRVGVFLRFTPSEVEAAVVDAGSGFAAGGGSTPGHLGMLGMRERAEVIRAHISIRSRCGRGTVIRVLVRRRTRSQGEERVA